MNYQYKYYNKQLVTFITLFMLSISPSYAKGSSEQAVVLYDNYLNVLKTKYPNKKTKLNREDFTNFRDLVNKFESSRGIKKGINAREAQDFLTIGVTKFRAEIKSRERRRQKSGKDKGTFTGKHVGTIVKIINKVDVLTDPSKIVSGDGVHVKYLDRYYKYRVAKLGDKLQNGDVLRTAVNSSVRVIFKNGDQINVAPGTSYKIVWGKMAKEYKTPSPSIYLLYGKIRAIFETKGPRETVKLRTRNASMGIRGTDFFVNSKSIFQGSLLLVIRGKVAITNFKTQKTVEVTKGYQANITIEAPRETEDLLLQSFDEEELGELELAVESLKITMNQATIKNLELVRDSFKPDKFQDVLEQELKEKQEYWAKKRREAKRVEDRRKEEKRKELLARKKLMFEQKLARQRKFENEKKLISKLKGKDKKHALEMLRFTEKQVQALEKRAFQMTLSELKKNSPHVYNIAIKKGLKTAEDINDLVLEELLKQGAKI